MADNTTLDPGTGGDTIATDDVSGVKYQRVKLVDGTLDSTTAIKAGGGVEAGALLVTVASDSTGVLSVDDNGGSLTVDGTVSITANSAVNVAQVAGTTTDTNSGTKSAGTQRVVLATDQPALTNALKVDGSAVTQPVSGTVSITANSAINNAQVSGTAVSVNSGTKDAGTQRVILASDQTVVPVSAPVSTPVFTTVTPSTTGGWSKVKYAAQTTTKQATKASAGTFGGYYVYNPNATVAYIQVFDVASGSVTLGTTAPDMIFGIPPTGAANLEITNGVNMATAITLACTTTATGSTAPGTGLDLTVFFK